MYREPSRSRRRDTAAPRFETTCIARLIFQALAAPASSGLLLLAASSVQAQTVVIPGGTQPYSNVTTGTAGATGGGDLDNPLPGDTGGDPGGLTATLNSNLSGGGSQSTLELRQIGGTGGTGHDVAGSSVVGQGGSSYAGAGGAGGSPSALSVTVNKGASITSSTTNAAAIVLDSEGGTGGDGGVSHGTYGYGGSPGDGGNAGAVTLNLNGNVTSINGWQGSAAGTTAIAITAVGGNGGALPGDGRQSSGSVTGRVGGNGGNGGDIDVTLSSANVTSAGSALTVLSQGGNGSDGGAGANDFGGGTAKGGAGGTGGNAGNIVVQIDGDGTQNITATGAATAATGAVIPLNTDGTVTGNAAVMTAGLRLQSFGGEGGDGGTGNGSFAGGAGGAGGAAGSAGNINLSLSGTNISTTGYVAAGVIAQSIGGSGGNGASAGGIGSKKAGNGAQGGNGGQVQLDFGDPINAPNQSLIETTGDDSGAVVVQSIGGGGGAGGNVQVGGVIAGIAIGGDGETGGKAGVVTVNNGHTDQSGNPTDQGILIATTGSRSAGIVAQSIGGGGGSGGSAQSSVAGPFAMSIGGSGGQGGSAGERSDPTPQVSVYNSGIIETSGDHSKGIEAQAVGGGGGTGGEASALDVSGQLNIVVSVGGNGGTGGDAGNVVVTNAGQIITQGNDAFGVMAQSVGGGGGDGGGTKAEAIQAANSSEAPSLNVSVAVGGQGGAAGNAGNVTATNQFSIMTNGVGSHGLELQSIGGGGDNGGDSSAIQSNMVGSNFNYNMALGGKGGAGGSGGDVTATNTGLIWTLGWFSYGILAQSVGGGGGNGGLGKTDTSAFHGNGSSKSSEFSLALGGDGGTGNIGGTVSVENDAGIVTRGDLSRGIFAQSVGGGGGNGGAAVGNGTGGTVQANIGVGGKGGSGNLGGLVTVTNKGAIYTTGADSAAIYAQSIGGGGGAGGSGAGGGGVDPEVRFSDYLASSAGLSKDVQQFGNRIYAWKDNTHGDFDVVDNLVNMVNDYNTNNAAAGAKPPQDGEGGGNIKVTLDVGGGIGGAGGSGNNGGTVTVSNQGQILTKGARSGGIYAESIGGGGGDGGSVQTSNNPVNAPSNLSATIGVGGKGGTGGDGVAVWVDNTGSIETHGDAGHGIQALSVGGGGGTGGYTQTEAGAVHDLNVGIGGDGGANGKGGNVRVNQSTTDNGAGLIVTQGDDAIGIAAQSIGGGGGNITLMHSDTDPATGGAASHSATYNQMTLASVTFNGSESTNCGSTVAAACGDGGTVNILSQQISTAGRNSYGILAQSIGGGGGWITGGTLSGTGFFSNFANGASASGDGQTVAVEVNKLVETTGDGAVGVLAQSIGGAGLLAGDTASGGGAAKFTHVSSPGATNGNGGEVDVTVDTGASIVTTGASAHGIFAQSVGGGGGLVTTNDSGVVMGSAKGTGTAGPVNVTVSGLVQTTGANANGVYVDADGGSASQNPVNVTVNALGKVQSGTATNFGNAIEINSSGTNNTVYNRGAIGAANALGHAVMADAGAVNVTNYGWITGDLNLAGGTFLNTYDSQSEGGWTPGISSSAGNIINNSEIDLSGLSVIYGNIENHDLIYSAVDFANNQGGAFQVVGTATLAPGNRFLISATSLKPVPFTLLQAKTLDVEATPTIQSDLGLRNSGITGAVDAVNYTVSTSNNAVTITPVLSMNAAASSVGANATERSVAESLDRGFVPSMSNQMAQAYAGVVAHNDAPGYLKSLDMVGNEGVQSVGTARLAASHAFVERMNDCPEFDSNGADSRQRDCAWSRVIDGRASRDADSTGIGYTSNNYTMQIGGQHQIADNWFLGFSAAYDSTNTHDAENVSSVSGKTYTLGAVLNYQLDNWLFSGSVDWGTGQYDSNRNIQLGEVAADAKADFNADHFGVHARIARQIPFADWYLKPYVDLHATHLRTGGYTESGAGDLDLDVSSAANNIYAASPMVEVGNQLTFENGMKLHSWLSTGVAFYSANDWGADMKLVGAPEEAGSFYSVAQLPQQRLKIEGGADLIVRKNIDVKLEYTGEFEHGYRSNVGSIKASYLF